MSVLPSSVGRQPPETLPNTYADSSHLPKSMQRPLSDVEFDDTGPGSHLPESMRGRVPGGVTESESAAATHTPETSDSANQAASNISDFLQSVGNDDSALRGWMNNVDVDSDGYFVHDINVERPSQQRLWGDFSKFSSDVLSGQSFVTTALSLNESRNEIALYDLNSASKIQEEVGVMNAEYEGFMAAVRTKDPEAVARAVNTPEDEKVITGILTLIASELMTNPDADVEKLSEAAETLEKIYKGEEVSKEELVKLEPNLESMGHKLFPNSVSSDYVADLISNSQEKLNKNPDLLRRTLG